MEKEDELIEVLKGIKSEIHNISACALVVTILVLVELMLSGIH